MTPLLPILSPRLEDALAHPDCLESLKGMRFGLEKEGLRVDKNTGALAQTPHAKALGSALTHPNITTDYSEALLEFVTATHETPQAALAELESLQAYSASVLGDERIWPLSMPCLLPESDSDIPLAYYGESHLGRLKTVYRRGLGFRYGRQMQTIAGVHFNLSWDDAFWHWRANR
jgi:Gamma-glutamylcysteine synthetase